MHTGAMPEAPYSEQTLRVISTKVSPEFQRRIREVAVAQDCTLSVVVKTALEQYVRLQQHT